MQFPFNIPSKREFDVVGFGTNAVDFLIQVPEYPAFDSKVEITNYIQAAGGEVATAVAGLRRLGCKTAYVGRFGSDDAGRLGLTSLSDEGVDLTYAETIDGARTQIAFIVIDERNGERTVLWQRDPELAYSASDVPLDVVTRTRVLHFTPHDPAACIALVGRAKEAGTAVSLDIDNVFDGIADLLPLVDVLIASADFPGKFLGIADRKESLKALRDRFGCAVVGLTRGVEGSIIFSQDAFTETPAFPVPGGCKDTTGAGDAFRVGFLYGMITGASIEESARMANATAALKCRALGARTALPRQGELATLLTSN